MIRTYSRGEWPDGKAPTKVNMEGCVYHQAEIVYTSHQDTTSISLFNTILDRGATTLFFEFEGDPDEAWKQVRWELRDRAIMVLSRMVWRALRQEPIFPLPTPREKVTPHMLAQMGGVFPIISDSEEVYALSVLGDVIVMDKLRDEYTYMELRKAEDKIRSQVKENA